ncbi:translocation/assembly module TamB domain-containing protein [Oricola cellulosilytica]|uniref:Translocation and assembly module TamB C-terminal domain-containing protein n=1 Tax=Oricola cellulosilytica TaxID=1429082 RepID=A0A4R0PEY9_9HYPH|nr:translocation/assembly module TamB domain-containing protein [Oricola cellulosilytica]TCD14054.1 hypothetical protein E0D97_08135 [Oricola cellulosilytica]
MRGLRALSRLFLIVTAFVCAGSAARAQEEEEKSRFIRYVEEQLSTPTRQIRLNGIQGTLSSNVSFDSITISDEDGVWLTIVEPTLEWQRRSLLGGKLDIQSLTAERIDWPRMPARDEAAPAPEASGFQIPELPVSVVIEELRITEAEFGQPVFGLASVLSLEGSIALEDGNLDAGLDIRRLDGPGGQMALGATYDGGTETLNVDFSLDEPADGVVANLLNIPERPPVRLAINGTGPVNDLNIELAFDVDGERIASGSLEMNEPLFSDDLRADLVLSGPIQRILPEQHRAFFGDETRLSADVTLRSGGGIDLRNLQLDSGALDITASASTLDDGFPREITADINLLSQDGQPVRLPLSGEPVTIGRGNLKLRYGTETSDGWLLTGYFDDVNAPDIAIDKIEIGSAGDVTGLRSPDERAIDYTLDVKAEGVRPADEGVAKALGETLTLEARGAWRSGQPVRLDEATVVADAVRVQASGTLAALTFTGTARVEASDLTAFSLIADRDLAGSASLAVNGDAALVGGAFDLALDGTLSDPSLGNETADRLLAGTSTLSGKAARSDEGLRFTRLHILNDQARISVDGLYASTEANLRANADIFSISVLQPEATGSLALTAAIDKPAGSRRDAPLDVTAELTLKDARLQARSVPRASVSFDGKISGPEITGQISGAGSVGGETIDISGTFRKEEARLVLDGFLARVGLSRLDGDIAWEDGLAEGELSISSNDISGLAALALIDAEGSVNGDVKLASTNGKQDVVADLLVLNARFNQYRIGEADIDATLVDVRGTPVIDATVTGNHIKAAGVLIERIVASANTSGAVTNFDADATLQNGTLVETTGNIETTRDGFDAQIQQLSVQSRYGDIRLLGPASISNADGVTRIESFSADVAGGRIAASGTVGETLDIQANIDALPLSVANSFRPDVGLAGTLSGTFNTRGTPGNPRVAFDARATSVSAAALESAGIAPIDATASGEYGNGTVQLSSFNASNSQNLDFSGAGTIPLSGSGLALRISGTAPLTFAERFLAGRGTSLGGTLRIDASVTGSLSSPNADGLFSLSGASITDPLSNLRLTQVGGVAGLRGDTISINSLSAQLAGGGAITVGGTVGIGGGLPANLRITLRDAVYSDGELVRTRLSGDLAISGELANGPLISGRVDLEETEITLPETLAGDADLLPIDHVNPDRDTLATLRRIEAALPKGGSGAPRAPVRLDVTVNSPNRIFVRGRGVDAEFGGRVRVTGPLTALQPVGSFNLIRGRLAILSKRLELTEGRITLTGSLDPLIDLVAQVQGDDIVASIRLSGRASDLSLDLSASPELPEDEILARILFGESITNLSPLQIANLATAVASLAGGGSGAGLAGQIREGIGVDDLDVVQDSDGNVAIRAGKYIQDNVYLDVQAGSTGAEASINLDITDSLTAKGTVDTQGDSKLGVFFEKDY